MSQIGLKLTSCNMVWSQLAHTGLRFNLEQTNLTETGLNLIWKYLIYLYMIFTLPRLGSMSCRITLDVILLDVV